MALPPYPLPAVTDPVYSILLLGSLTDGGGGAKRTYNQFYYRLTTPGSSVVKSSLITAFNAAVIAPLLLATVDRYKPNYGKVRNVQDYSDYDTQIAIAGTGAIATDGAPSDTAVVVNLISPYRGKMCRGNKHFAGIAEASTTADLLNAGGVTLWSAVRDGLKAVLTDAQGNVWTPFMLSKTWSKLTPTVSVYGVNISNSILLKTIGTMRKRRTPTVYA